MPHPSAVLVTREEARRRSLLLGIGALLFLSLAPIFGHHVAEWLERGMMTGDHLARLCLIALHALLEPVHYVFHGLLLAGLAYAFFDRGRAALRARRTITPLATRSASPGDGFWIAATAARVDPRTLRIVDGLPNPAFTAGWFRPKIFVAGALATTLRPAELTAVLAHEQAHVDRRDPLRLSLLRFLACTLFWIPALRTLAKDIADETEIRADDVAARNGSPLDLASALVTLSGWRQPFPELDRIVGIANAGSLLERRIRRLAGETPTVSSHLTFRTIAGALFSLVLVLLSGAVMAHPLPLNAAERLEHCEHPGTWPGSHIACAAHPSWRMGDPCPHGGSEG